MLKRIKDSASDGSLAQPQPLPETLAPLVLSHVPRGKRPSGLPRNRSRQACDRGSLPDRASAPGKNTAAQHMRCPWIVDGHPTWAWKWWSRSTVQVPTQCHPNLLFQSPRQVAAAAWHWICSSETGPCFPGAGTGRHGPQLGGAACPGHGCASVTIQSLSHTLAPTGPLAHTHNSKNRTKRDGSGDRPSKEVEASGSVGPGSKNIRRPETPRFPRETGQAHRRQTHQ